MLASLRDDFRLAFRSIRRAPGPVLVAVVSLGLAIGANTAVLAVADAYFLRPLPYETAERLILVWETTPRGERRMTVSPGNFSAWRERAGAFEDLAAYNIDFAAVSGVGDAERIRGSIVTGGFFPLLGVTPLLGTGILPEHDRPEAEAVVLISHGPWAAALRRCGRRGRPDAAAGRRAAYHRWRHAAGVPAARAGLA